MEKGGTSWNENRTAQHKRNIANCQIETHSACNYKYVILSKDLKTGLYVRCKCKRKHKWKCKRVDTSKANTRKERYASVVEAFLEDGRQWLSFTDSHVWVGNANASSRKWKFVYYLRWRLRLHLHLRWVGSHEQLFLSFAFAFAFLCDWLTERGVGTNPTTLLGSCCNFS